MKRQKATWMSFVIGVALVGCGPAQVAVKVLFIGNSHTYVNKVPEQVLALANAGHLPWKLEVQAVAISGATLERQLQDGRALSAINEGGWNYVVLQEQSAQAVMDPQSFEDSATALAAAIRKVGAKPILYMGWARKELSNFTQNDWTNEVLRVADLTNSAVAPVGEAWRVALEAHPALELYQADGNHAAVRGSYLAACVFFATLFDRSPVGLPGRVENPNEPGSVLTDLDSAQANELQQFAWDAVQLLESPYHLNLQSASR
jgi:hypothetical protein